MKKKQYTIRVETIFLAEQKEQFPKDLYASFTDRFPQLGTTISANNTLLESTAVMFIASE